MSGLQSVLQAPVCDGGKFDTSAFCEDLLGPAEVDICWRQVVDAFMIADVVMLGGGLVLATGVLIGSS